MIAENTLRSEQNSSRANLGYGHSLGDRDDAGLSFLPVLDYSGEGDDDRHSGWIARI